MSYSKLSDPMYYIISLSRVKIGGLWPLIAILGCGRCLAGQAQKGPQAAGLAPVGTTGLIAHKAGK